MKTKFTNLYLVISCALLSSAAIAGSVNHDENRESVYGFSANKQRICTESANSKKYLPGCFYNVTASNITSNSATLSNTEYSQVNFFQYKVAGATQWTTLTMSGHSVNISGLTPLTQYYYRDSIICSEFAQVITPVQTFVTSAISYCSAQGNNAAFEWINCIVMGSTTNSSGQNGGYGDFTGVFLNASKASPVNYVLTPGYSGYNYVEKWCAWIDFNHDGDFNDPAEKVIATSGSRNPVSGSFIIPYSALNGVTRMRITMSYYSISGSCMNPLYGEVEDYTITILSGFEKTTEVESLRKIPGLNCVIYPNPCTGTFNLEVRGVDETADVYVKNVLGQLVYKDEVKPLDSKITTKIDLSGLGIGVYTVCLITKNESVSRQLIIE